MTTHNSLPGRRPASQATSALHGAVVSLSVPVCLSNCLPVYPPPPSPFPRDSQGYPNSVPNSNPSPSPSPDQPTAVQARGPRATLARGLTDRSSPSWGRPGSGPKGPYCSNYPPPESFGPSWIPDHSRAHLRHEPRPHSDPSPVKDPLPWTRAAPTWGRCCATHFHQDKAPLRLIQSRHRHRPQAQATGTSVALFLSPAPTSNFASAQIYLHPRGPYVQSIPRETRETAGFCQRAADCRRPAGQSETAWSNRPRQEGLRIRLGRNRADSLWLWFWFRCEDGLQLHNHQTSRRLRRRALVPGEG